ncbi:cobalt-factor II C(20)-methyltransferase [Methanomassiliicoccus luminyensis]|uniref:cobalt-factor II C(20)-methyltransferase n=1 Tax=Methanomassiliicoccus luminyensis TaxID=1080712 RepID=UPI000381274F|nr:cobalt-factor II C(20)-methyltransferase [Methanomassiliicoccus luminyensis]
MLIGIGLGPGDKELLTLRAVRLLKEADKVFVPGKMAKDLVAPYTEAEVLEFPMSNDEDVIRAALERNAERIAPAARNGTAVLGMIGDPSFYSTFSRQVEIMRASHPDIETEVEPGISSITAFASRAKLAINGGFVVTDGEHPDAMIMLKVKKPGELMRSLQREGYREFVLAERVFQDEERIYSGEQIPEQSDYFSIMYARK